MLFRTRNWLVCPYCGKRFESPRYMAEHVRRCSDAAYERDRQREIIKKVIRGGIPWTKGR